MPAPSSRRRFLETSLRGALAGGVLSSGELPFLGQGVLRPVTAEEARLDPRVVRLQPELEPLVRLLEETPREELLEKIGTRIREGTSYREVLAALLLAGVRNVEPRPAVGFKFHAVLVVNSAHLASLASPDRHRWLPIFWALDYFKSSQARDVREGNWTMGPVDEARVPPPHGSRDAFRKAMESWDVEAADAAVAGLVRHAGAQEVFEEFFRIGARDFRSIGHKIIFVSNAWRTLAVIGWQHAEPVVRSLAYALLQHEGGNPAGRDAPADRPGRRNRELVKTLCAPCAGGGKIDPSATAKLLEALTSATEPESSGLAAKLLDEGLHPRSLWDACFQSASDQVLRQPGIISLHAATTINALHFAHQTAGDPETRTFLLLQAASFLPLFRAESERRGGATNSTSLTDLEASGEPSGPEALERIFDTLGSDPTEASRLALRFLDDGEEASTSRARQLMDHARLLVFQKGNDAHDYKYSSAILEDFHHLGPGLGNRFLAASLPLLPNSRQPDNRLVERIREALPG